MRKQLILLLILIPALPLAGLGLLGVTTFRSEQELISHRRAVLLEERLRDIDGTLKKRVRAYQRRLMERIRHMPKTAEAIREEVRKERLARNMFRVDKDGRRLFPQGTGLTDAERRFIARTDTLLAKGELSPKPTEVSDSQEGTTCDWLVWHLDRGIQLIYRCAVSNGEIAGVELDPMVVASDLISELPETAAEEDATGSDFRIRLLDIDGEPIYQWGRLEPKTDTLPSATLSLSAPLSSYRLVYFTKAHTDDSPFESSVALGLVFGFGSLLLAIAGLGIYFVREAGRDAQIARQRMTFVNQVSHELKTPLTNLRMYAELLDEHLDPDDDKGRRFVNVIITESERLSRLIANVLSFARQARGKLTVRRTALVPDSVIRETMDRFLPGFEQAGIAIETALAASESRSIDADALSQVLSNLLSNVEKYAAEGGWAGIESRLEGARLIIEVTDAGGGIPAASRDEIFTPFFRLSNTLTDGASGTGIGLTISRELCRRHGGDLELMPSDKGARFRITIEAPATR